MAEDLPSTRRPRRLLRTILLLVGALLVVVVAVVFIALPRLARPYVERTLTAALQKPVTIGSLGWSPLRGEVSAGSVGIGGEGDPITATRVSAGVNLEALWRGAIVVERIDIESPVATLALDKEFRPLLGPPSPGAGAETSATPALIVRQVVVNNGTVTIRYPVRSKPRNASLQIAQFTASDVDVDETTGAVTMNGKLEGALDGAPVHGDVQLKLAGADTQITANFGVSGVTVSRDIVPMPEVFDTFTAKVDATGTVEVRSQPPRQALQVDLGLSEVHVRRDDGTDLSAKSVAMPKLRLDLLAKQIDLGAVTIDTPVLVLAPPVQGAAPAAPASEPGPPSWSIRSAEIQLRGGTIDVKHGETTTSLALESVRWDGLRPDHAAQLRLAAKVAGGGSIAAQGTLGVNPLDLEVAVQLTDLPLTLLSHVAGESPLALSKGTVSGTVNLGYRDRLRRLDGLLTAQDVHTAPSDPTQALEVMAFSEGAVQFSLEPGSPPTVTISSLKLSYPYVMVHRDQAGTFPMSAFAAKDSAAAPPDTTAAGGLRLRIQQLDVDGGKLEFLDSTLAPPFWSSLTSVTGEATEILHPEGTIKHFEINAKQDELSPAKISGTLTAQGLDAKAEVRDMLLGSLNAYISPVLGYEIKSGRLSSSITASPAPPLLDSTVEVVLRGIEVLQTGHDIIQAQSGIPLPIALGLIANTSGEIRLTLPFMVDTHSRSISFGSIVWQAVRSAIIGALTSPLRLLGSLFGTNGSPHAFAIDPIPFAPGQDALDQAGRARVAQIARIMGAHQGLVLVLMPQVTPEDIRKVGAGGAADLANERNAAVREAFAGSAADPRLPANRLILVPWKPATGADATRMPGVYVELQDAG